ncbi:hypothetical protein FA13DRAFT_1724337 [Coprinellus micaceus]|uniref:Uncharacterized protein n=1 Tax=Coprinellus micaceus TaxID=71717 RepID=A0A4Y7U222_COPMI|nr:hypothetical protein FA13DRAFT_1724337 [Coprinellus micaceus]
MIAAKHESLRRLQQENGQRRAFRASHSGRRTNVGRKNKDRKIRELVLRGSARGFLATQALRTKSV